MMALFLSLAFAAGGTMLGEVWFWLAEGYRIGNSHMSYRAGRLFWARHRPEWFAGAVIVFWVAAIESAPSTVGPLDGEVAQAKQMWW